MIHDYAGCKTDRMSAMRRLPPRLEAWKSNAGPEADRSCAGESILRICPRAALAELLPGNNRWIRRVTVRKKSPVKGAGGTLYGERPLRRCVGLQARRVVSQFPSQDSKFTLD